MSGIERPEVYRRMHHEMMRNMEWDHKEPNGMTSRLLTRAKTNAFEHNMLTMHQILDTLVPTDEIYKQKTYLKELSVNISHMSKLKFEMIKHHAGLKELAARNLKQAYALAYELKNILDKTEAEERNSCIIGSQERENSRFRWEDGLLHRELDEVTNNIEGLVYALLPGYMR